MNWILKSDARDIWGVQVPDVCYSTVAKWSIQYFFCSKIVSNWAFIKIKNKYYGPLNFVYMNNISNFWSANHLNAVYVVSPVYISTFCFSLPSQNGVCSLQDFQNEQHRKWCRVDWCRQNKTNIVPSSNFSIKATLFPFKPTNNSQILVFLSYFAAMWSVNKELHWIEFDY